MDEIINKLGDLATWYAAEGCKSNNIDELLERQGEIAGLSYTLAEAVAMDNGLFIAAYNIRKLEEAKNYIEVKTEKNLTVADAERLALLHTKKERLGQTRAEIDYNTGKIKLMQINKVLDAMAQKISYLKKEKELTFNSN